VVVLGRPKATGDIPDHNEPNRLDMLPREMVRQAVLIAARDELGATTRDEVIDETPAVAEEAASGTVEVVSFIRDNRLREQIRRIQNERIESLFSHETPTATGRSLDLVKLSASAEALSRQEFPAILKGLGLAGKPNVIKAGAEVPQKVEDRLARPEFLEVFLAVRDLHATIRTDGESPARLGALARGYALLGVLSEFQWHPAHRAFKARALLYAQRLIARDPSGPSALWHRAFVLALIGRHRDALADLDRAKKVELKGAPAIPDWLDLVGAYCHYDPVVLAEKGGRQAKLAKLLRMLVLAFPRSSAGGLKAAQEVVLLEPFCFRAHDVISDFLGVSTQHVAGTIWSQALDQFVAARLGAVDVLPASVKDHLQDKPGIAPVAELFDKAGSLANDTGEPSWGAMGRMIRETRFVQVFRRLYFMKSMLAAPADDYWREVRNDFTGHRYRRYLEILGLPDPEWVKGFRKFDDEIDLVDIEPTEMMMIKSLEVQGRPRTKNAWVIAQCHADETAEMALALSTSQDANKPIIARDILECSSYHPYARAVLIDYAWDAVKDQVPTWEKESANTPAIFVALARHYSAAKNYEEARRALLRYIELSPDGGAFRMLASNYKAQGMIDRWKEALEASLKEEDLGLDHARARVEIADYYMEQKQWDKAKPYAELAAMTWAEWAMICAGRCAEGEKDWNRAEEWYSRVTQRYLSSDWAVWYFFCKRAGQGNLAAARASVEQYLAGVAGQPGLQNEEYAAYFHWLEGQLDKAKAELATAYSTRTSISAALCLAMILDDDKNAAGRDELLNELVSKHSEKAPRSVATCRLFLESIFAPAEKKKPLDLVALDRTIESVPEQGRGNIEFFVGWFLKNHGDAKNAKKYLEDCANSRHTTYWYVLLAKDALKRLAEK
jgi:tetratricopeptide (TPR) repeat protein